MKKLITICLAAAMILAIGGMANANQMQPQSFDPYDWDVSLSDTIIADITALVWGALGIAALSLSNRRKHHQEHIVHNCKQYFCEEEVDISALSAVVSAKADEYVCEEVNC
ncbi:MAG: hypothetical protein NTW93_08915 [Phycisphaerae bacterium]|nr:hypothetical protein [Phycisphaerae bacterium]